MAVIIMHCAARQRRASCVAHRQPREDALVIDLYQLMPQAQAHGGEVR